MSIPFFIPAMSGLKTVVRLSLRSTYGRRLARNCVCGLFNLLVMCELIGAYAAANQLPITTYGQASGLSSLSAICLYQDRDGFVWVGTEKGLYRFDGMAFEQIGPEQGFQTSEVISIAEDANGDLLVGSRAGLQRRDHGHFDWIQPDDHPLFINRGQSIAASPDGLFVVSESRLLKLTEDQHGHWYAHTPFTTKQLSADPTLNQVYALLYRNGSLWFGCGTELCQFKDGVLSHYGPDRGIPNDRWLGLLASSDGSLWVRGIHAIRQLANGSDHFIARDMPAKHAEVSASSINIVEDQRGRVITRSDRGVARWDGARWNLFDDLNGIPAVGVSSLVADHDGTLWMGTYGRGLLHWNSNDAVENWTAAQGLNGTPIWSIARADAKTLWIADDNGGSMLIHGETHARHWPLAAIAPYQAHTVLVTSDGAVWYFLFDGRVLRYQSHPDRTTVVAVFPALVRGAYLDRQGMFWAYTLAGLYALDPTNGKITRAAPELIPPTMCSDIAEDATGRLWAACSAGLFRRNGQSWARIHVLPQESPGGYENAAITPDGHLWLSSLQPGLLKGRIDDSDSIFMQPVVDELLADTRFYFLRTDRLGRLWAGGNSGVDVLDDHRWIRLTSRDGLLWDETNHGAFYADNDGSIWIGSPIGLSHLIAPKQLLSPRHLHSFVLAATYGDHDLISQHVASFDKSGALVLRFAVLGNSSGNPVHFRYHLSDIDKDWVETGAHDLRYASLPSGHYRFELVTVDENQRSLSPPVTLSFTVTPPWWLTPWAYACAVLVLLGTATLIFRWRMRVLVAHAQLLEATVTTRTQQLHQALQARSMLLARISHDLRSPLTSIIDCVSQWLAGDVHRDYPRIIEQSARQQLDLIDDLLEFSKDNIMDLELVEVPGYLHGFLRDIEEQALVMAERENNHLECHFDSRLPALVKTDFRRLRQILLNLLSNAAKFTHDGQIRFEVITQRINGDYASLRFTVEDNGIGLGQDEHERLLQPFARGSNAIEHQGSGLGLAIVSQWLGRMHSRLQIKDAPSEGSHFSFVLDLAVAAESDLDPSLNDDGYLGQPIDGSNCPILVVDDHPQSRDMLCDLLDSYGFSSMAAANGRAALQTFHDQSPALVITDQYMDDIDGWKLLQTLREEYPGLPVILYSALPPRRPVSLTSDLEFDAVLLKPSSARQLLHVMAGLIAATNAIT